MKLHELNITPSHSRPRVSNDNAYAESLFRTQKYVPQWLSSGFSTLEDACNWVDKFTRWHNEEHVIVEYAMSRQQKAPLVKTELFWKSVTNCTVRHKKSIRNGKNRPRKLSQVE